MAELIQIPDTTQFETIIGANAKFVCGGVNSKIVPNVNMGKWDDEAWFNLNPKWFGVRESTVADFKNGLLSLRNNGVKWQAYVDLNGRLEAEIAYASNPGSANIEFDLLHSKGLSFWHQGELTAEEIKEGAYRPDDIIDSYAVYFDKTNNRYKAGKFGHLHRVKFIDANFKEKWAEWYIEAGKLIVIPDFTGLTFPVILDPTLNGSGCQATETGLSTTIRCTVDTTTEEGAISAFHACIKAVGASTGLKLAVYNTSGGSPSSQAIVEGVTGVASISDDIEIASSTTPTLSNATAYAVCIIAEHTDTKYTYDGVGSLSSFRNVDEVYGDQWEANAPSSWVETANRRWGIWIDYGAAGGAIPLLVGGGMGQTMGSNCNLMTG